MSDTVAARLGGDAAARLAALGVATIDGGLTDDEFARIEAAFGFEFADDHRAFLAAGLPVGGRWPDWRNEGRRSLRKRLKFPLDGVLFDVEWSDFWGDGWGQRPSRMKDALRTATYQLARVPRMVPLYSHRYLPGGHGSFGHPVLSIVQTDIIVYGADLPDYIESEFVRHGTAPHRYKASTVGFWSDVVS
ncbi:MAG TPA: hypothetical protein VEX40_07380 [Mycobacterium sp.]|nr:hypothetical protein [Mycobacterium sp.]